MPGSSDPEYTLDEAADALHISVRTLQRLIDQQLIGFERVGSRGVRLRESDLAAFRESIRAQRRK